ncbi:hypothetical protein [Lacipirellula parvula]|uniref:Uncharacterized protein n=1 Tax=Lacipirellula parvula TaxID=2650471 RepID=A0A5K7XCP4_9BACT|nr:hypothetical protein [Lacipirellula parvula]BBO32156.1 hypothetical protein PLANPX_1768 [Lacipirellula parvula]
MIEGVSVQLASATESSVRLSLVGDGVVDLAGEWELYGPRCEHGRTLASTFRGKLTADKRIEFLVTEPCYWSAAMPFLYELRRVGAGATNDGVVHTLGLQRLSAHAVNLRLGGERIVLRGAVATALNEQTVREAHEAESAIIATAAKEILDLSAASRWGATVLVDASSFAGDIQQLRQRLSWEPAVAALLHAAGVHDRTDENAFLTGVVLPSQQWQDAVNSAGAQLIVADLAAGERPPAALVALGKPVIAVRRSPEFASFAEARAACDRLQAELAPEFNLAGYFAGHVRGAE